MVHETVPNIERGVHYRQVSPEHLKKAYTSNILKYGSGILPETLNGLQQNYHEHNVCIFIACLQTNETLSVFFNIYIHTLACVTCSTKYNLSIDYIHSKQIVV